jgi:class 3 adenylate cyclase
MDEREKIQQAIRSIEAQRAILGNTVVETALAPLREKLATLQIATEQQRKQVTILFADISSFTASAEQMDAEDLNNIINNLWARLDQIVIDHGGRIDKHIGDALMALWGVETATEDDPERAILAALAMQSAAEQMIHSINLPEIGALSPEQSALFKIRIGVHTGPVVLGQVGTQGEFTAMGDAVNVASRLEHAAPIGGVLVSHDTYRHVQGVFNVRKLPPLTLKGKSETILAYLVLSAKPRAFRIPLRGVEGIETNTIGQEEELNTLWEKWGEVLSTRQIRVISVIGEAGIGKSRLMDDLRNQMEFSSEPFRFFEGRGTPQTRNIPFGLIRDIFENRFLIQDSDQIETILQKLEQGLKEFINEQPTEKAHLIGALLGYDLSTSPFILNISSDAQQIRERGLRAIEEFFIRSCQHRPIALFLDNIHWSDENSLETLKSLSQVMRPLPFFMVCIARPSLFEHQPNWGKDLPSHTQVMLKSLAPEKAHQLVKEILRRVPEIPNSLIELITNRSDGNPYYIEELIKMMIDEGIIVPNILEWRIEAQKLSNIRIPQTLAGVIQARLDALPRPEREVLQKAAVVGRVFWESVLMEMNTDPATSDRQTLQDLLKSLQARELIFARKTSSLSQTSEYIFKHHILQEVTYQQVLKRQRRIYHEQIANWLIAQSGERADEYAVLIAEHFEQAENRPQAAEWYRRAGQQAAAQFANQDALRLLQRSIELLAPDALHSRYSCLLTRVKIYDFLGMRTEQTADLESLGQLAEALQQDQLRAEVCLLCAEYALNMGNYNETQQLIQRTLQLTQSIPLNHLTVKAHLLLGLLASRKEKFAQAQQEHQYSLDLAQRLRLPAYEVDSLRGIGNALLKIKKPTEAEHYQQLALSISRKLGDQRREAMCTLSLGAVLSSQNKQEQARQSYLQAIHLCHQIGDILTETLALNNLGSIETIMNNQAQGLEHFKTSLALARQIGLSYGIVVALGNISETQLELGLHSEALRSAEEWLQYCQYTNDLLGTAWACNGSAKALSKLGLFDRATAMLNQARSFFAQQNDLNGLNEVTYMEMLLAFYAEDFPQQRQKAQELLSSAQPSNIEILPTAHWIMGNLHCCEGNFEAALSAYNESKKLSDWQTLGLPAYEAGRILALTRMGNTTAALQALETALPLCQRLNYSYPAQWSLSACIDALHLLGDQRTQSTLALAQHHLQEQAKHLDSFLQDSFLHAVPLNRRLLEGQFPLTCEAGAQPR